MSDEIRVWTQGDWRVEVASSGACSLTRDTLEAVYFDANEFPQLVTFLRSVQESLRPHRPLLFPSHLPNAVAPQELVTGRVYFSQIPIGGTYGPFTFEGRGLRRRDNFEMVEVALCLYRPYDDVDASMEPDADEDLWK